MKPSIRFRSFAAVVVVLGSLSGLSRTAIAQQKPSVNITWIRNVDEPGLNYFQTSHATFISGNSPTLIEAMPVPPGKTVVIEHVSLSGRLATGSVPLAYAVCVIANQEIHHSIPLTMQGSSNGTTAWSASQPIKCYAGPNTLGFPSSLYIRVETNVFQTLQPFWTVAASGYVVD